MPPTRAVPQGLLQLAGGRQDRPHPQLCSGSRGTGGVQVLLGTRLPWTALAQPGGERGGSERLGVVALSREAVPGQELAAALRPPPRPWAQRGALGAPPLAEGISYLITSRQDNLSNFAWKKSLTNSSKATIMPDETVIEFAFLLLSQLSSCCF